MCEHIVSAVCSGGVRQPGLSRRRRSCRSCKSGSAALAHRRYRRSLKRRMNRKFSETIEFTTCACRSRFGTHAHNENANLSNGRIFKGWIFEFRAAHSVIRTLIVRYAMTLCPEALSWPLLRALVNRDVVAPRRADVELARTADLLTWILDHFLPLRDPAGGARHRE
jgi:hypothetical protein